MTVSISTVDLCMWRCAINPGSLYTTGNLMDEDVSGAQSERYTATDMAEVFIERDIEASTGHHASMSVRTRYRGLYWSPRLNVC